MSTVDKIMALADEYADAFSEDNMGHFPEGASRPKRSALRAALVEALEHVAQPQQELCMCKDRPKTECPGEWEPGCDLGANEKFVRPYQPQQERCTYPDCNCPFDAPSDPAWCAKGLSGSRC